MKKNYEWREGAFFKKITGLIAVFMFIGLSGAMQAQTTCVIDNQQSGIAAGTLGLFAIADNGISTLFDPSGSGDFGDPGCFLDTPYTYLIANVVVVMADASLFGIPDEGMGTLEYKVTIESVVDDTCSILGTEVWTSTTLTEVMADEGFHVVTVPVNYITNERVFITVTTVSWSGSLTRAPSVLLWDSAPRGECRQFVHSEAGSTITAFENFFNGGETGWTTISVEGVYDTPTGDVDFAVDSISAPDSAWVDVVTVPVKAYIKNMGDFNVQGAKILLKENGTAVDSMLVNLAKDSSKMVVFNYAPTVAGDNTVMAMAMVDGDVNGDNDAKSTTIVGKDFTPPCEGETIICDGFDLYQEGPINGQGSWWSTWSGQLGGAEDGIITTDQALSAPNSMFVDSTGSQDVLLLLGNQTTGTFALDFNFYIPSGQSGYYNIQEDETPGVAWNLDVFFNEDGGAPGVGSFAQSILTFTYPEDAWFKVHMVIDLDANLMSFTVDGNLVFENFIYEGSIGAVDIFSISNNNKMYVDDVAYYVTEPLSACGFPTFICDNFDDYTLGALASQSAHWSTWSGDEGGPEDGIVDSTFYNSPTNSMFVDSTGSQDVLLLLGNKEEGSYTLEFNVYIPAGRGGYYNIQDDETPGIQWDLEVYFNEGGSAPGVGSFAAFSDSTFTYPEDEWFNVKQVVDLNAELMSFWVNGTPVFQKIAYAVDGKIGAIDFFSASNNNKMYVDDVIFYDADPLSACDFPTIICDNIDDYTVGAIGPQADWWSTWSGDLGGAEDGIVVDTVFNSAPNSMYVGNGGTQDVLLLLGNKETGAYSLDFNVMVPEGAEGYFNIQDDEVAGQKWNLNVFFNRDGAAPGVGSFESAANGEPDSTFTYPVGEWFPIHMVIDLDANLMSFWADGNLAFEGYVYGPTPGSDDAEWKIGSMDIWSSSDINHIYIDDIVFDESEGLSACSFPTIICDNYDSYSTGSLGSQATHWSTWSGELGGAEDGIVTTDQALSAPNSMFIDSTGTQDVLLLLGNKHVGTYVIEMDFYIPAGFTGYYNIQNEETPGVQWNLNVFFNRDGANPGVGSFEPANQEPTVTFDYPEDEWFHINMGIDLVTNVMAFTVNGVVVFSDFTYEGDIGSLDFFSLDSLNQMYVDNVVFFGEEIDAVQELTKLGEFKLYPNPNDGNFTITSAELSGTYMVEMIDMSGRIVYSEQIVLNKNENKVISTNNLNTGMYILRMVDKSTSDVYTTRVSIQ